MAEAAEPETGGPEGPHSDSAEEGGEALGWEQAGCLLWDVAALPDDAAFLLGHGLPAMLPPLLTAAAAREQWRALEIGLGMAANLACHKEPREQVQQLEGLPALLLDRLLWVDDSASLAELRRCIAGLLPGAGRDEVSERWWALPLREETLGRLVWIVENTLSSSLLERSLNLLSCLVTAAGAAAACGDGSKAQLVPQLTALGLLPLLASVLHGWAVRLKAEGQAFGEAEVGGAPAEEAAQEGRVQREHQREQQSASKAAGLEGPPPGGEAAVDESGLESDAAAGGAVAAEVTEAAALEALALLEALAAEETGEIALNASAPIKDALLRTVAETDQRGMQALATSLLAGLEGVGPQLLAQPAALAAILRRLAAAARERPEKRARTEIEQGCSGGAAQVGPSSAEEQAEEVEAGWALCSALARTVSTRDAAREAGEGRGEEGTGGARFGASEEALGVLAKNSDVLCYDWSSSPRAVAIQMHQTFVLRCLAPMLEPRLQGPAKEALQAALARIEAEADPASAQA